MAHKARDGAEVLTTFGMTWVVGMLECAEFDLRFRGAGLKPGPYS
jgi:hypothetical protein